MLYSEDSDNDKHKVHSKKKEGHCAEKYVVISNIKM